MGVATCRFKLLFFSSWWWWWWWWLCREFMLQKEVETASASCIFYEETFEF